VTASRRPPPSPARFSSVLVALQVCELSLDEHFEAAETRVEMTLQVGEPSVERFGRRTAVRPFGQVRTVSLVVVESLV